MKTKLYTIVVSELDKPHPYWKDGAFIALEESDWGPSPVFSMVTKPTMFTSMEEAQRVLKIYAVYGLSNLFEIVTYVLEQP